MNFFKCLGFGLVGGAIGAAIWAGVTLATNMEIGWIAWGVGALAGLGVRFGAREAEGFGPGFVAVVVTIAAIAAGKFAAVYVMVERALPANAGEVSAITDEVMIVRIADEVVEEFEADKKRLNWPAGYSVENADAEAHYPKEVWAEAKNRYETIPPDQREKDKQTLRAETDNILQGFKAHVRDQAFAAAFGPMDILFFLLGIATAYRIGSGSLQTG